MTTLVGLTIPGKGTYYGSDSMISSAFMKVHAPAGKFVTWGKWALGIAGDLKTINLFQEHARAALHTIKSTEDFIRRATHIMGEAGYNTGGVSEGGPPTWGQSFLLCNDETMWEVDESMATYEVPAGTLWAVGSGQGYALGASHATRRRSPEERVRAALNAAAFYDPMSGGPLHTGFIKAR